MAARSAIIEKESALATLIREKEAELGALRMELTTMTAQRDAARQDFAPRPPFNYPLL